MGNDEKNSEFLCGVKKKCLSLQTQTRKVGCNRNVAQLVAHYVRDVGVGRSSRLIPTREAKIGAIRSSLRF